MYPTQSDPHLGKAKASYLLPLLSWVSQFVISAVTRSIPHREPGLGWAVFHGLMALLQLGLLVVGLVLSIYVLTRDRQFRSGEATKSAIIGLIVSGGTFALILVVIAVAIVTRA